MGYSLSFVYKPAEDGRGLRYQAGSQWGATQSGVSYSYQWIRVDGVNESDIGEESTATYTPVQDDVGKTLKVRANFTDDAGFDEQRTSAPTATVTAAPATCPAPDFAEWLSYLTTIEGSRTRAGRRDEP